MEHFDSHGKELSLFLSGKGEVGKGKGGAPVVVTSCQVIPVIMDFDDLRNAYTKTEAGGTFDTVPFYNAETGELLGYYSDSSTDLESEDCVGTGAFSFDYEEPYVSQIAFQFTCFGEFNSITGGTGEFGCASGFEEFVFDDGNIIGSELNLCGPLCPYVRQLAAPGPH